MTKSIDQQIANLQDKLNRLRTKKQADSKREDTRQKIILGAEVGKVLNKSPVEVNQDKNLKALIFALLSKLEHISGEKKDDLIREGLAIMEAWKDEKKS
ncbi:TPA: hypothetical protein R6P87_005354 [Klebsiella pneumoniae]|nr:hypothetical protein [Klebsiella pneumoniae]